MYVFLDSLYNVAYMYSIIWYVCIHLTIRCMADLFIYVLYIIVFVCSYVYIWYVCEHRRLGERVCVCDGCVRVCVCVSLSF